MAEKKSCLCKCVCGIKFKFDLATPILQKSKGFPLKIKLNSNKRVFIWTLDVAAAIPLALYIPYRSWAVSEMAYLIYSSLVQDRREIKHLQTLANGP